MRFTQRCPVHRPVQQAVEDVLPPLSEPLPAPAVAGRRALRDGAPLSSLPFPVTQLGALEFEVKGEAFKLIKTAPAVVNKAGQVIVSTPSGVLYGLPNPDVAGTSWASPTWVQAASDDEVDNSCCYDLVLDPSDSMYQILTDRNLLQGFVYGYRASSSAAAPAMLWPGLDLGANLQLFEFYHISALQAGGQLLVPTVSLLTQVGAVWINLATGAAVNITIDSKPNGYGDCVGNAWIDATNGAACMLTHASGLPGTAMQTWAAGAASPTWSSTGVPAFTADITQANPTVDPWTKNVYWVGLKDTKRPAILYCVRGTGALAGQACAGFADTGKGPGVDIKNLWGPGGAFLFPIQWVFAGSIVPNGNAVGRLLFTFTLQGNYELQAPTGCIMALSPTTGALLDSYCVARDTAGVFGVDNFLATAPIVALDARGVGAHTAVVAQFDMVLLAFDPSNLAAGPLYAAAPLVAAGAADSVASDFLSMTAGGTVLIPSWDDGDKAWSTFAVPGFLKLAPTNGPTAAASGLSSGQKAGVAIGVILALGALGAFWWFGGVGKLRGALAGLSLGGSSYSSGAPAYSSSSSSYARVSAPASSPFAKSYT